MSLKRGWRGIPSRLFVISLLLLLPAAIASSFPDDSKAVSVIEGGDQCAWFQGAGQYTRGQVTTGRPFDFQTMLKLGHMLYIGERDSVYAVDLRLSMSTEIPFEKRLFWGVSDKKVATCMRQGRKKDDCFNFIKILLKMRDDALFVCGTNAHNPVCRMYKLPSLEFTGEEVSGTAKCPYDARHTAAAVYAGGKLYSATVTDFLAVDTVIYRSMGDSYPLRTVRLDSKWLKEPVFIDALEYGEFVYFFFREIAAEFGNLGKLMVSRVARVCKNDAGGSQRVLERHWTSFVKTRLNCSVPGKLGEPHFYFNELQAMSGVVRISDRDMVVGVFTTPPNSIFGSAVCAFHMEEIDRALDGRLQEQRTPDSYWTLVPEDSIPQPRPGTCARRSSAQQYQSSVNFPDPALAFIKTHTQAASAVPSTSHRPWLVHSSSRDRLLKISIDPVAGPWGNRSVLYLGSEHGLLLKVLVRPGLPGLVLEEIHMYNPHICGESGSRDVRGLQIDASRHTIYVAFAHCLLRLPLSRCERHGYCQSSCLASRDPYCGWKGGACVQLSTQSRFPFKQAIDEASLLPLEAGCVESYMSHDALSQRSFESSLVVMVEAFL
uniref:semaphorin-6A-like isoform X2 n=1 Tax=Myxine glutinosa TaxID=7769 RepID=UPI00358FC8EE